MTRNIPKRVREILRKEVNFGCPVEGCGSPYLSYHHFDPQWHIENHHRPEGMIALCLEHHRQADFGAFTYEQLRTFKQQPYLENKEELRIASNWKRQGLVVDIGGNIYVGAQNIFFSKGYKFIWITNDSRGYTVLNFDIKSKNGDLVLSMRENDWVANTEFDDIECKPSGKNINLKSVKHELSLSIRFENYQRDEFYKRIKWDDPRTVGRIEQLNNGKHYTLCSIRGSLQYPFRLTMTDDDMHFYGKDFANGEISGVAGMRGLGAMVNAKISFGSMISFGRDPVLKS